MIMCPRTALRRERPPTVGHRVKTHTHTNVHALFVKRHLRLLFKTHQKLMACRSPLTLNFFPWPCRIATLGQSICARGWEIRTAQHNHGKTKRRVGE